MTAEEAWPAVVRTWQLAVVMSQPAEKRLVPVTVC
jgi:hypothetical protein